MGLRQYLLRRVADSLIVVFLVFLFNFFLFYSRMPSVVELPLPEQFSGYLHFVFVDGFTISGYRNEVPTVVNNLPFTLFFLGVAITIAVGVSLLLGAIAAYKCQSILDTVLTAILLTLFMVPTWWMCMVFVKYGPPYFPVSHWYSISTWAGVSPWTNPLAFAQNVLWHMILPITALTLGLVGVYFLVIKNSMIDYIRAAFVTTAKAKGATTRSIIFKHILRNALLPITAMIALTPVVVMNVAVSIERVFTLPGLGYSMYRSMISSWGVEMDPTPFQQVVFLTLAIVTVGIQFFFDVAHHALDPRLRVDGGRVAPVKGTRRFRATFFLRRFLKKKTGLLGLVAILFFVFVAILAPVLPLRDPDRINMLGQYRPPSADNILGTDEYGRDVLARLIWGSRVSLMEFFGALVIALLIGCTVGLVSGYYDGRWFSYLLDRVSDVFVSIPLLMFVVYFPLVEGTLKWIVSVGIATWGITAKIVKSQVITVKERAHIETARAAGASNIRIVLHYVLPESFSVVASSMIYTGALVIGLQSALDFFGFRRYLFSRIEAVMAAPATWGTMISYGSTGFIAGSIWWVVFPPVICMVVLGLSIVFVTDAVIYALNPQFT